MTVLEHLLHPIPTTHKITNRLHPTTNAKSKRLASAKTMKRRMLWSALLVTAFCPWLSQCGANWASHSWGGSGADWSRCSPGYPQSRSETASIGGGQCQLNFSRSCGAMGYWLPWWNANCSYQRTDNGCMQYVSCQGNAPGDVRCTANPSFCSSSNVGSNGPAGSGGACRPGQRDTEQVEMPGCSLTFHRDCGAMGNWIGWSFEYCEAVRRRGRCREVVFYRGRAPDEIETVIVGRRCR